MARIPSATCDPGMCVIVDNLRLRSGRTRTGVIAKLETERASEMLQRFWISMREILHDEQGATAIEYGLIAALETEAIFAGALLLGTYLNNLFNKIATFLGGVGLSGA